MARKSVIGQLNMFDLYDTPIGDVEMVSLMPSLEEPEVEEEPEVVEEPEVTEEIDSAVVMSRSYERDGEKIEIAYINYNKVRIKKGNQEPEIKVFESSKDAVDFYVQEMQALEEEE